MLRPVRVRAETTGIRARDLEAELEELRADSFGYYDEGGRGALLNRRL